MRAPDWMSAVIRDFGRGAGLDTLELSERGAAALRFASGAVLRFEYVNAELVVALSVPEGDVKRLLSLSHPRANFGFRVRTGILPHGGARVIAIRMQERDVTLPRVSAVFDVLWRLGAEIGGASWA